MVKVSGSLPPPVSAAMGRPGARAGSFDGAWLQELESAGRSILASIRAVDQGGTEPVTGSAASAPAVTPHQSATSNGATADMRRSAAQTETAPPPGRTGSDGRTASAAGGPVRGVTAAAVPVSGRAALRLAPDAGAPSTPVRAAGQPPGARVRSEDLGRANAHLIVRDGRAEVFLRGPQTDLRDLLELERRVREDLRRAGLEAGAVWWNGAPIADANQS